MVPDPAVPDPKGSGTGQPLLVIENLQVRYGEVEVLRSVGLSVREGEIAALIGANGAGKTTLLMAISGLVPAAEGRIRFAGQWIQGLAAEQVVSRGITQVPEGRRVFARLTVEENLRMGAVLREDRAKAAEDLDWVLKLFPVLKDRRRQLAGTLSGGEQQMLALGRGLMARPQLLMLDEPSLGLAPKVVADLFRVIRQIHEAGVTLLLVEQNAYQALQVAQTAYVLQTGSIVLQGSAEQLREDPAVKAAYLGG